MQENYFSNIEWEYGITCKRTFKAYSKNHKKIVNTTKTKDFLIKCRKNLIIPSFIQHRTNNILKSRIRLTQRRYTNYICKINRKILNFEITDKIVHIHKLSRSASYLRSKMFKLAPQHIVNSYIHNIKLNYFRYRENITRKINEKYERLEKEQTPSIYYNKDRLKNLSDIELPKDVEMILSFGPKFTVYQSKPEIPLANLITDIEYIVKTNQNENLHNEIRGKAATIISNFIKKPHTIENRKQLILHKAYKATKNFLKINSELIVTEADKGNVTIIMNKSVYEKLLSDYFEDSVKYRKLSFDPTLKLQEKNNNFVRKLFKDGLITKPLKRKLSTYTAQAPRPKCTPKIHKEGIRVIINGTNSPSYDLARFLNEIFTMINTENKYNIKNSKHIKDILDNTVGEQDDIMISLDVISMYERIPIVEVFKSLEKRKENLSHHTKIPWTILMNMVKFCIDDANYLTWNGKIYKQKQGLTIGGSVSGILADFVITDLLDYAIYESGLNITLVKKYVDDMLIIISRDEVENFLNIMNSVNKAIQFTLETEEHQLLPFLDLRIHRKNNNTFETSYYQKVTSKNRILNYHSAHPHSQKIGTAYGLIHRIINNTSPSFKDESIDTIHKILSSNNYPTKLTQQLINKFQKNITTAQHLHNTTKTFRAITYTPSLSENIQNLLQKYDDKLKISFRPTTNVGRLIKLPQSKLEPPDRFGVVYKFDCNGCNGTYIGQTGRKLSQRIKEHKNDVKQKHSSKNQTAAISHILNTGHTFNYDDTQILTTQQHYRKRLTLESININLFKDTSINLRSDINSLNPSYTPILQHIQKHA